MPILRTDLERALDELISQEEGMRFQALSVVLGKQRWPELIARQRKKDFGLDAYADASVTPEKVGTGLAASITASLKKISSDTKTAKEHFPDLALLLFVTPGKVGNADRRKWEIAIQDEHAVSLQLLEREEIIALLMMPENVSLCASFLHLSVAATPQIAESIAKMRRAASLVVDSWALRTKGLPLVELRAILLDAKGANSDKEWSLADIDIALSQSRRIVLEGPAGRGKTTTVIQLAQRARAGRTAFVLELSAWTTARLGILEYLAGMPSFQAQGIAAGDLARLQQIEGFLFLLNGWNEIAESNSALAIEALRELERTFPAAGILVATRAHHLTPPLPGALRMRLQPLDPSQRTAYLSARLGAAAGDLCKIVEARRSLDELTRSPFILSEVASLFEARAVIPETKVEVLGAVVRLQEEGEHRNALQGAPLFGCQQLYLEALALELLRRESVTLGDADARTVVTTVGKRLLERGQIGSVQEPSIVLASLTAHHLLERIDYPEKAFRFEHQQFQEYYAAVGVQTYLLSVLEDRGDARGRFIADYVNDPAWAEPLRMIAERLAGAARHSNVSRHSVKAGSLLIGMALFVDPIFASELARLCGPEIWSDVRSTVGPRLRELYAADDRCYQEYALVAMMETGSPDFKNVLIPLLSSEDKRVRQQTYALWSTIHLTCLGRDWAQEVRTWNNEARTDFVDQMLAHHLKVTEVAEFAVADRSAAVKEKAATRLQWLNTNALTRVLESMDADTFENHTHNNHALRYFPAALKTKTAAALRGSAKTAGPASRLRAALGLIALRAEDADSAVKEALTLLSHSGVSNLDNLADDIRPALEHLCQHDALWVSEWVAAQIVNGRFRYPGSWVRFLTTLPDSEIEKYLQRLEIEALDHPWSTNITSVLARIADTRLASRVFTKVRDLRSRIDAAPDAGHDREWTTVTQLERLFRAWPGDVAAAGILTAIQGTGDPISLKVATGLLDRLGRADVDPFQIADQHLKNRLRTYLKDGVEIVLRQDDFYGKEKANLASCIAQVGLPEDMKDVVTLIRADIARVRRGRAARTDGNDGPVSVGGMLSYASWYITAVLKLNSEGASQVLIDLLSEPEYVKDVADAMARDFQPRFLEDPEHPFSYNRLWAAREGRLRTTTDDERRVRFAAALSTAIRRELEYRTEAEPVRDVQVLARALALIDGPASSRVVLAAMEAPRRWDESIRVETAERLLMSGAVLPAPTAFSIVESVLSRAEAYKDQDLLTRALCLCPFVDVPATGIAKVRDVLKQREFSPKAISKIVVALGQSRTEEALELLLELSADAPMFEACENAFISAAGTLDTPRARDALLGAVDPDLLGFPFTSELPDERWLVWEIFRIVQKDPKVRLRLRELCDRELPDRNRQLLARILGELDTPDEYTASLKLIADDRQPAIPEGVRELFQRTFRGGIRGMNELRKLLFRMQTEDKRRRKSAASLLALVEKYRFGGVRTTEGLRHPDVASGIPWPPATPKVWP